MNIQKIAPIFVGKKSSHIRAQQKQGIQTLEVFFLVGLRLYQFENCIDR